MAIHRKYAAVALYPKGPVLPDPRVEWPAARALQQLTDEQFERIVLAERARRRSSSGLN